MRARGAALDTRRARDLVELEQPVQRAEVDRDGPLARRRDARRDPADDRRAAAVGDRGDALIRTPLQKPLDLALVARARDEVGRALEATVEAVDDVGVGLAQGVRGAGV